MSIFDKNSTIEQVICQPKLMGRFRDINNPNVAHKRCITRKMRDAKKAIIPKVKGEILGQILISFPRSCVGTREEYASHSTGQGVNSSAYFK